MWRRGRDGTIETDPTVPPEAPMLRMQHAQLALILMEQGRAPKIEFPSEDREHQRQLERVRDSLLRHPERRPAEARGA
jgi:hypothetical protein